jgi:hypothetical protein
MRCWEWWRVADGSVHAFCPCAVTTDYVSVCNCRLVPRGTPTTPDDRTCVDCVMAVASQPAPQERVAVDPKPNRSN